MNNIYKLNSIIEYIEENIRMDIDLNKLAQMCGVSLYEFRRIFSFAAGVPVGEYVRKRRLTLAAADLAGGKSSVTCLAAEYGYDSPSSFARAFKDFHGISPTEAANGSGMLNMFTRLSFDVMVSGGTDAGYRLIRDDGFYVCGISGVSGIDDTECCEAVWDSFYESRNNKEILGQCGGRIYSVYDNGDSSVVCTIGARSDKPVYDSKYIPPALWMCFDAIGADDKTISGFYNDILFKQLESCGCRRIHGIPNLEIYPEDMSEADFKWEIRIPVGGIK